MIKITTKTPLNDNFVKAFDYYKSKSAKTGREIANHLGTSPPTVSNWSSGKHLPDMDTLQRLAKYLDAPVDQFFNFTATAETEKLSKLEKELISLIHELSDEDIQILKIVTVRLLG